MAIFLFPATALVFFLTYHFSKKKVQRQTALIRAGGWALFFALANGLGLYYVAQEKTLYSFDAGEYWARCISFLDLVRKRPWGFVEMAFDVRSKDSSFSLFPYPLLLAGLAVFGQDRAGYVVAVTALFAFPAVLLWSRFLRLFSGDLAKQDPLWAEFIPPGMVLLFPHFWAVIWRGFPDVGGLILVFLVLSLYFGRPLQEQSNQRWLWLGVLLGCTILVRRWYAYWVVSFLLAALLDGLFQARRVRPMDGSWLWRVLKPVLLSSATAGLVLLTAAPRLLEAALSTDISHLYSAYRRYEDIPWWQELLGWFGISIWILFLGALAASWRRPEFRRPLVFLLLQMALSIKMLAWGMIDYHGINYLYQVPMVTVLILGACDVVYRISSTVKKCLFLGALAAILLVNSASVYCFFMEPVRAQLTFLFPARPLYPEVRTDIPQFLELVEFLEKNMDHRDRLYVLASSEVVNETLFTNYNLFWRKEYLMPRLVLPTVDLDNDPKTPRNFHDALTLATIVLVAEPTQYHLRPSDQQIIGIPARTFLDGKEIAQAFKKIPQAFSFDHGVNVFVYHKYRTFTQEEYDSFFQRVLRSITEKEKEDSS